MQIIENDWLTWQRSSDSDADLCRPPARLIQHLPDWFKNLKRDVHTYTDVGEWHNSNIQNTIRQCEGLRGATQQGWTIPYDRIMRLRHMIFHPEQLHGSIWAEKDPKGRYAWQIRLLSFPWRARVRKPYGLMVTPHPLCWSRDWYEFSGLVQFDWKKRNDDKNYGSFWSYDYDLEDGYNYHNIESVVAFRSIEPWTHFDNVPDGTTFFSLIPTIYEGTTS